MGPARTALFLALLVSLALLAAATFEVLERVQAEPSDESAVAQQQGVRVVAEIRGSTNLGDSDGDGFTDEVESGTPLCGNGVNEDDFDDAVADDGCPEGPPQAGSFSEGQFNIGTDSLSNCQAGRPFGNIPSTDWPLDLHGGDLILDSRNLIDVADLGALLAPLRRLDTSPGDANYDQHYDLIPGPDPIITGTWIDVSDFGAMLAGAEAFPPMFGVGVRALDGPSCTP